MNAQELIARLESSGVSLWVDGNNVRFKAPEGLFPDPLKLELKIHKAEIISFMAGRGRLQNPPVFPLPDQAGIKEWVEERAAIIEFEGKITWQEADKLAAVNGSKQFCPVCRAGACGGCLLEKAFIGRQESARVEVEKMKGTWEKLVLKYEQAGLGHEEAIKRASMEVLASDVYRASREI
jgi:hypothetical protein